MKKKIITIGLASVLILGLSGCSNNRNSQEMNRYMNEWISPDGVHYWMKNIGNHTMMAPRYDHEGNLVIENWDVQ